MKQLYCTNTDTGQTAGLHVRAASAGLGHDQVQAAARYADYAAPVQRVGEAPTPPPVRLAWLHTPDAGRLLCHSTCLGIDPATGKNGRFFSHLLLDVPATLDAHQVIQTWGSQLWQRSDNGGGAALPEALYLPVSSALGDAQLKQFLDRPAHRDLLQFLLAALLSTPPHVRVFIAAPAEDVALCVYGVTRALPHALLHDFTFSTYEHDPLSCHARLVGTCSAEPEGQDLPPACYEGAGVAYHGGTGRRSEGIVPVPFVEFAVEALATGQVAALDEFHGTWQRLGVQDHNWLDFVYRLARGTGTLTKEESHQVLHHPTLGTWIVNRPDALQQFLEWALDDHAYATATYSRAVFALRRRPDALAKLAKAVEEQGLAALREGNLVRTQNALEVILPMAAPARAAAVWNELFSGIDDPEVLPWEMRCYLLPRLARIQATDGVPARWLHVPADRLEALLGLDLPQTYHVAACLAGLRHEGTTPPLARALATQPRLLTLVLQQLAADADAETRAGSLFDALLSESPHRDWVDAVVRQGCNLPRSFLNRCLSACLERDALDPGVLVRDHGAALLDLLAEQPSLDRIAQRLLLRPADELLAQPTAAAFLHGLTSVSGLSEEVRTRLDACHTVQAFLRRPTLERESLGRVMAALRVEPPLFPPRTLGEVLEAISAELAKRTDDETQSQLEGVLLTVGPCTTNGPAGLYRDLLHRQRKRKQFWKQPELVQAFLAVALGAAQSGELAALLGNLEGEAYALARQTGQCGGKRVLHAIERHAGAWPRAAQSQWHFLAKAVQPRGMRDLVRDAGFFLSGAAVAIGVALGLKWLGML